MCCSISILISQIQNGGQLTSANESESELSEDRLSKDDQNLGPLERATQAGQICEFPRKLTFPGNAKFKNIIIAVLSFNITWGFTFNKTPTQAFTPPASNEIRYGAGQRERLY